MPYDFDHLSKDTERENAPGLKTRVLVAPKRTFTTLAAPLNTGATPGDSVAIDADHVFDVADGFIELYTTMDTAEFIAELIGERDNRNINPKLTCFHPGTRKEALEFAKKGKSEEWIVLVEDLENEFLQIGSENLACEMSYSIGKGKVSGGQNGITFTFETFGDVYVYEGAIVLKP